jgi:hypothetical protein
VRPGGGDRGNVVKCGDVAKNGSVYQFFERSELEGKTKLPADTFQCRLHNHLVTMKRAKDAGQCPLWLHMGKVHCVLLTTDDEVVTEKLRVAS